jgi:hypothetical protein
MSLIYFSRPRAWRNSQKSPQIHNYSFASARNFNLYKCSVSFVAPLPLATVLIPRVNATNRKVAIGRMSGVMVSREEVGAVMDPYVPVSFNPYFSRV